MDSAKPAYTSKTVLGNLAIVVITYLVNEVQGGLLPPELMAWAPVLVALGNVALRFFTTMPVKVL